MDHTKQLSSRERAKIDAYLQTKLSKGDIARKQRRSVQLMARIIVENQELQLHMMIEEFSEQQANLKNLLRSQTRIGPKCF